MGKATATRPKHLPIDAVTDAPLARTDFNPSESQQALLAYMQAEGYDCTIVEACAACNVGRRTYYDWTDIEAFNDWWRQEAKAWEARQLPRVVGALVTSATSQRPGTSADRKTYFERNDPSVGVTDTTVQVPQVTYNFVKKIELRLERAGSVRYHPELPPFGEGDDGAGRFIDADGMDSQPVEDSEQTGAACPVEPEPCSGDPVPGDEGAEG